MVWMLDNDSAAVIKIIELYIVGFLCDKWLETSDYIILITKMRDGHTNRYLYIFLSCDYTT